MGLPAILPERSKIRAMATRWVAAPGAAAMARLMSTAPPHSIEAAPAVLEMFVIGIKLSLPLFPPAVQPAGQHRMHRAAGWGLLSAASYALPRRRVPCPPPAHAGRLRVNCSARQEAAPPPASFAPKWAKRLFSAPCEKCGIIYLPGGTTTARPPPASRSAAWARQMWYNVSTW